MRSVFSYLVAKRRPCLSRLKGALDCRALLVELLVVGQRTYAVALRGDHGGAATVIEDGSEWVGVEGLVCEQTVRLHALNERNSRNALVTLAFGQLEGDGETQRIDDQMDFGRRTTA